MGPAGARARLPPFPSLVGLGPFTVDIAVGL